MALSLFFLSLATASAASFICTVSAVVPEPIATANVDNTKNFDPAQAFNTTNSANASAIGFTHINLSASSGIPMSSATTIFIPTTGLGSSATATASTSAALSSASVSASFSDIACANTTETTTSSAQQPTVTGKKAAKKASKKSKKAAKKSSEKAKKAKKASKKSKKAAEASRD